MGQAYQAQDLVLKRPVAVKVLLPQFARNPGFVQRFRREAEAAAALNHENVVDVYDYGIERATQFIVMEFIEGRSLAEYIEGGGKIWPARSIDLAMNVAYALGAAHERGIVHRDIKPANVMVSRDGVVKVTDFGIAWVATDSAATGTQVAIGTAPYMSPEQAQAGPVDGRSDIYSLGCTLYHFVTGRPPFVGGDLASMLYRHVHEMPTPPSQLNPDATTELDAVVMRCLSKNPAQRYQTARELNVALRRVGRGLPPYEWLQVRENTREPRQAIMFDEMTIGRDPGSADLVLADNAVSRTHAQLNLVNGSWVIVDLGSTNKTLVNGNVVQGSQPLKDGDVIRVGQTEIELIVGSRRPSG